MTVCSKVSFSPQVGLTDAQRTIEFNIHIGDVVFFPIGTQHYIKNTCDEDLLFVLAFSTGDQVSPRQLSIICEAVCQDKGGLSEHMLSEGGG